MYNIIKDFDGRFLACTITTPDDFTVSICNIYGPNEDKPAFYSALAQNLSDLYPEVIIVGDYNVALNPELDKYGPVIDKKKSRAQIIQMMDEFLLEDVWENTKFENYFLLVAEAKSRTGKQN